MFSSDLFSTPTQLSTLNYASVIVSRIGDNWLRQLNFPILISVFTLNYRLQMITDSISLKLFAKMLLPYQVFSFLFYLIFLLVSAQL
jgi:hypothetical protein